MHNIFRYIFLFLISACCSLPALALIQDREDDYYIIASAEDFIELTQNSAYWTANIKQIFDVDLKGAVITPIGNGKDPFKGVYDGKGCTISNAKILWNDGADANHSTFGVFGAISGASKDKCAKVSNLNIKNVQITRTSDTHYKNDIDIRIGILVGYINEHVNIHDICVSGCSISDGGHHNEIKGLYCGGVLGDMASSIGGTENLNDPNFLFKNIFSNVYIDLSKTKAIGDNMSQVFVGGIAGRLRKPDGIEHVPDNTIYKGTIIAPDGSESPTIGNIRTSVALSTPYAIRSYAGELKLRTGTDYNAISNLLSDAEFNDFCSTRLFYSYSAYNSAADKKCVEAVTATYPDPNRRYMYKNRTFGESKDSKGKEITPKLQPGASYTQSDWALMQGVNFGAIKDASNSADLALMETMLDAAVIDKYNGNKRYDWSWNPTTETFELKDLYPYTEPLSIYIDQNDNGTQYVAKVTYKNYDIEYPNPEEGKYQWEYTDNIESNTWFSNEDDTNSTITPNTAFYYRVTWTKGDISITSPYRAPASIVYVYNRQNTIDYYNTYNVAATERLDTDYYTQDGVDEDNYGRTPQTPVKTMRRAYEVLDLYGGTSTNRIVVMGYLEDNDFIQLGAVKTGVNSKGEDVYDYEKSNGYCRAATVSGTDNKEIYNGRLGFSQIKGRNKSGNNLYFDLEGPLTLEDIYLHNSSGATQILIVCNFFDLTIGNNVYMIDFPQMESAMGLPGNIRTLPHFTIVAGYQDYNENGFIKYPCDIYPLRTAYSKEPGRMNMVLNSGVYGRIICANRNNQANPVSNNITGLPEKPSRMVLKFNISNDINLDSDSPDFNQYSKYGLKTSGKNFVSAGYTHNVGLIAGGQTDGSVYGDAELNIYSGYIARVITGNISYGRNSSSTKHPADSYFGRSVVNIYGKASLVEFTNASGLPDYKVVSETTINEMVGGILGRYGGGGSSVIKPYFYGESVINIYGGFLGKYTGSGLPALKEIEPSLYGAGSGGVSGLGDDSHHTHDDCIPYIKDNTLYYGNYAAATAEGCSMPVMTMYDGHVVDLKNTSCAVNLYSGIIEGSVYGGGFGYSNNIAENLSEKYPGYATANCQPGVVFGNSSVKMIRIPEYQPAIVLGNIYGGSAGDKRYAEYWKDINPGADPNLNPFREIATQYGDCTVILQAGTVGNKYDSTGGDVYGGAKGIEGYPDMATLYGKATLEIDGATIYGNIYGGSNFAAIKIRKDNDNADIEGTGSTYLTVNSGTIGNNIFGGSKGSVSADPASETKAIIEGSTNVDVLGGDFINWPYIDLNQDPTESINIVDNRDRYRTFNIYGGGYLNCDVKGDANVNVRSSLLSDEGSILDSSQNPNSLASHTVSKFQAAYMDITYRCFCVYGGGFGEKTNVLNTNVYVTIPRDRQNVSMPHGITLDHFLEHQSFFDIAGGGYSGDVGYWITGDYKYHNYTIPAGTRVSTIDIPTFRARILTENPSATTDEVNTEVVKLFDTYYGGECNVTIDDYTFARKVIGGGFYGSCRTTNTHVRCGSLRQVYGGSLLGYVHDKAYLQFGNRVEDFVRWDKNRSAYVYNEDYGYEPFRGDYVNVESNYPNVWALAEAFAKELNDHIFITENIYGGNDVKGIIGTKRWESPTSTVAKPVYGIDETDGGPLFCTDIDDSEKKGIVFNIYGGTFMGDIYGAGNGHYRGYYVPEWVRYNDGPVRMYRSVKSSVNPSVQAKAYRSRPMVGSVNINLRGNSANDMINVHGNFFGGGRECTIGQFNTILPLEDPRRLVTGGFLHVNFGGFTQVDGNVYMGAEGRLYSGQQCVPAEENIDLKTFDGSTTKQLARLGDVAYDHWYFDTDDGCYLPGYPAPDKVDGNFGLKGEHMLGSYMQNVQMQGDVELTFYRYLYERDKTTNQWLTDSDGDRIRKHWIPGEKAVDEYDATDIVMNSFFLGGLSGSMTNNNLMAYCYTNGNSIDPNIENTNGHDHEAWGTVYRITLPKGVTIHDKVVMGSENAITKIYAYNSDYTKLIKKDNNGDDLKPIYMYEGGIITQHTFSYDLIAYNDKFGKWLHQVPADFYTDDTTNPNYADYKAIRESNSYTLKGETNPDGSPITIYRKSYNDNTYITNKSEELIKNRYSLAWKPYGTDGFTAYIGPRDHRKVSDEKTTVTKLTIACAFDQIADESATDPTAHKNHYGGNIYGGCYNSGVVMGDVVMNIGSNLLGSHLDETMASVYEDFSSLKYNIGRVFGGGYGQETRVEGDTYVNLLRNFKGMNVFGGGMEGDVTGTAHVTYIGTEDQSYVFGSIYGGGLKGTVGTEGETYKSTIVRLFSGNVEKVYGGSCMGDLYGRTYVELCDQVTDELDHLDYSKLSFDDWSGSRLIVGKVFGGNDIAGNIHPLAYTLYDADPIEAQFNDYTTGVYVHEVQLTPKPSGAPSTGSSSAPGKTSPGNDKGYNGFPLIGDLFGGSNGDYGVQGAEDYISGEVELATGNGIAFKTVNLSGMKVPHVDKSHILINGGTIINAYGGGDMCNIREDAKITVKYPILDYGTNGVVDKQVIKARAGFDTDEDLERVWTVLHFSSDQQRDEVAGLNADGHPVFTYQIYRLFGGNNNADMAIQPNWALSSGNIGSLYSGGNFGKMTYYQPKVAADNTVDPPVEAKDEKGLTLTVNSYDLTINNVFGGGRVGDIDPSIPTGVTPSPDFYGATLNIERGIIDHVYGGNDVAGYVSYGTNVNLHGAISGDVYCAGNGNYLYKYDRKGNLFNYTLPGRRTITEDYAFRTEDYLGARYFMLPAKAEYGFDSSNPTSYNATDAQVIMAINSYRPNVERAKLHISGTADNKVWVRGNVYCGGNSATVTTNNADAQYDVKFDIGSHVILNGVFLGSNGASLSQGDMIMYTEKLNGVSESSSLKMSGVNNLTVAQIDAAEDAKTHKITGTDRTALDLTLYPKILDLYMRAVETTQKPQDFDFASDITDAYIGEFCVGGNRGSMMTDEKISLNFPASLTIFNHIIGGCKDANVTYNGTTHIGGLTVPLAGDETVKVDMKIRSRFRPLNLLFPDANSTPPISIYNYLVGADGKEYQSGDKYYQNQQCNIFGGCYTSGTTIGGVNIDLYSDMLNYECNDTSDELYIDKQAVINGIKDIRSWRSFTVVGAGYGANTAVYGNINVRMLPEKLTKTNADNTTTTTYTHPSVSSIFGGSQEGIVVGNTNVEIRDGKVLANVYGASEAAKMYGSTSVIIGYPKYYRAKKTGNYRINRADYMSEISIKDMKDGFNEVVVPKTVAYLKGDIVPNNVVEMVLGRVKDDRIAAVINNTDFRVGKNVEDIYLDLITSANLSDYFEPVKSIKTDAAGVPLRSQITPEDFDVEWKDITIWIGDQGSNINPNNPYYGQGNVYGGGYIPNSSDRTLIGQPTIMRFTNEYNIGKPEMFFTTEPSQAIKDKFTGLYGGNTAVIIWDNAKNVDPTITDATLLKDHIHIGTGIFKKKTVTAKSNAKGLFKKVTKTVNGTEETAYIYQTSGHVDADALDDYYEKTADGGLYGGGRKVFAQAFRSIDLAYYGYAEHSPQSPKLLNTIQHSDVATITDCCIELVGASDFTVEDYKDIYYAINRVGELIMVSSLDPDSDLDQGYVNPADKDGVRLHTAKRSRNYIALYNKTNHLAAFRSNWSMEKKYHGDNGAVTTDIEKNDGAGGEVYGYPNGGKVSYVNRKHRYVDLYNEMLRIDKKDKAHAADATQPAVTTDEIDNLNNMYKAITGVLVSATAQLDLFSALKTEIESLFRQRNVGTSGNMIGISSGYELSIEGLACQRGETKESRYYGPAYGVTEMKLLTTVSGMGGGYVYALNHHYDAQIDASQAGVETEGWCSKFGQDFLQTAGNFVFPGASYETVVNDALTTKNNFIIDDCFDHHDPMNHGYYACDLHDRVITRAPARLVNPETYVPAGVNKSHEVHYWYVSGNTYVYNVTITGITSDTSPDAPRNFWLSNENDMVNLFNIKPTGTDITVTDVTWFEHDDMAPGDCDIADMDKEYELYLTIDHDTRNTFTDKDKINGNTDAQGAFVIRIPRHSYTAATEKGTNKIINSIKDPEGKFVDHSTISDSSNTGIVVDPNYYLNSVIDGNANPNVFGGTFTEGEGTSAVTYENKPRLGLRLVDGQRNRLADEGPDAGTQYYNKHLKSNHNVQVTLTTQNGNDEPIIYKINIDIKYLMGPALFGKLNIENCALPGEYIYVNADDIQVLMDENLGISQQKWRLYPNDADGQRVSKTQATTNGCNDPDVKYDNYNNAYYDLNSDVYTVANTERLIHIPAYYYQNGWEVVYAVTANGEDFEASLPYAYPDDYEVEAMRGLPIAENRLQVHNYHRMKPLLDGNVIDLRLTPGARVYLENEEDMNYFFEYVDMMQTATVTAPYKRYISPLGAVINPQYCKSLDFYQQKNLTIPTTAEYTQNNDKLYFTGSYHGNGNWMIIPDGASIYMVNGYKDGDSKVPGYMYNTGFVSEVKNPSTNIYNENYGTITNCFYFHKGEKGALTNSLEGKLYNCYQNTRVATKTVDGKDVPAFNYNELMQISTLGFRYGQVAYNLNGFYLQKRHKLLHDAGADNNDYALRMKDRELRGDNSVNYSDFEIEYIEKMFNNGDYRYAFYNQSLNETVYTHFTEALRTADVPNYFDFKGQRNNNLPVSMHDYTHKVDEARWCNTHHEYHPIFDTDYMFFGEDLTKDVDAKNVELPEAFSPANRVYRVGGFYGSAADKGYFMNRKAYLDTPLMTAIDFVGYRDRDIYEPMSGAGSKSYGENGAHGALKSSVEDQIKATGWIINSGWHEVFMPPTLDLPWVWSAADGSDLKHDFSGFSVNSDKVTHNLLIYTENLDEALEVMEDYHYQDKTYGLGVDNHSFALHPEDNISAHHIIDYADGPKVYGDYFHLVDKHDFYAPVGFKAKQAWYNRKPTDYSAPYTITEGTGTVKTYKTAWEGICLPFDVKMVYAASTNITEMPDMGEITHFFDEEDKGQWKGHEYWLRRFVGVDQADGDLLFERPTAANQADEDATTIDGVDAVGNYQYSNTQIYDMYKSLGYDEPNVEDYTHDRLYHFTDPNQQYRTISNYRYLSHSIPYIVAYPCKYYYEFDLSGEFFAEKAGKPKAVPQTICYLAKAEKSDDYIEIPMTVPLASYTYGDASKGGKYTMKGTFLHVTDDKTLAESVLYKEESDLAVLDAYRVSDNGEIHHGTGFTAHTDKTVVEPFRTYIVGAIPSSSKGMMLIGSRDGRSEGEIYEEIVPEQAPSDQDTPDAHIRVWTEGSKLVIDTPYDLETNIYSINGSLVKRVRAYEGINRYSGLPSGFYIVLRTKVYIK